MDITFCVKITEIIMDHYIWFPGIKKNKAQKIAIIFLIWRRSHP
jgi:hypothetical protein